MGRGAGGEILKVRHVAFAGFPLNDQLYKLIIRRYSDEHGDMDFDNFVGCLVRLDSMISEFALLTSCVPVVFLCETNITDEEVQLQSMYGMDATRLHWPDLNGPFTISESSGILLHNHVWMTRDGPAGYGHENIIQRAAAAANWAQMPRWCRRSGEGGWVKLGRDDGKTTAPQDNQSGHDERF